jgi:hypothetical protein
MPGISSNSASTRRAIAAMFIAVLPFEGPLSKMRTTSAARAAPPRTGRFVEQKGEKAAAAGIRRRALRSDKKVGRHESRY